MTVTVRPIASRRDLKRFVKLPFRLYRDDPNWVPPLISERMKFLDRSKNPFFEHAEAEYFIAYRGSTPVGRVAACIDRSFQKVHESNAGSFGFFECEDSQETADALMATASSWLAERGCDRLIGPLDFSTNDECGLLVEGNDSPPFVLMPYQPTYYKKLLKNNGLVKAMDLLQWQLIVKEIEFMPVLDELAENSLKEHNVTLRELDRKNLNSELEKFFDLYNATWEKNWGFVPLTKAELEFVVKDLKAVIEPSIAIFAEKEGEVVGCALCLPNINEVLPRLKGRLLPFGWLKFLLGRKKIQGMRVIALGVLPEYQHTGVAAALYVRLRENGQALGYETGELGWVLETNKSMNKAMEAMGAEMVKRYRIFERETVVAVAAANA